MTNLLNLIVKPVLAADIVGDLVLPGGIPNAVSSAGPFISVIIRFIIIIGGLFTLWQFLTGGLGMITGGSDKGKISEAQNKITMAITGLAIMAASFLIIGIISQVLFGNFMTILNPQIETIAPPPGP